MNDTNKELAGFAERLKKISIYQQLYQKMVKELIRDMRMEIISPHESPLKQVASGRHGEVEIKLDAKVYRATREVIRWTLDSDRSISVRVKDDIMEYIDDIHNPDFESRNLNSRVCIEMIEAYCKIITKAKEKRDNEARIKIQKQELAKRTIARVLRSQELHITCQKNSRDAILKGLSLENSTFSGYGSFDRVLSEADISDYPELKIYLHHKIRKNDETIDLKVFVGNLKNEKGMYYLNNTIPLGSHISVIEKWLKACYAHLAGTPRYLTNDPDFPVLENITELTQKKAERLAEIIKDHYINGSPSERRSLELIRETLGDDAHDQLKNKKRLVVKSSNGKNYIIRDDGDVIESETGRSCCVIVDGDLPKYDAILAKYLAIRDRPETIKTLVETSDNPDPQAHYLVLFTRTTQQFGKKIEQMGFKTGDFSIDIDTRRSVWSISMPLTEVTIKGGKDFTPVRANVKENDLTMELWDKIEANELTPEFLHGAEYMNAAFDHYLAYLGRYLAWSPEYVIMRNENYFDHSDERSRRLREIMGMRGRSAR